MAYTAQWGHKSGEVRAAFDRVQREHPDAWEKTKHPHDDKEFIQLVGALVHSMIPQCGLNGKRGNAADLSKDVLAFPNPTGCRDDRPGGFSGLELVDIIARHETSTAAWAWTDVTQATIDGGSVGEWVLPGTYPGGTGPTEPEEPEEPAVSKPYPGDDFFWHSLGDVLEADYRAAGQTLNAGSSVWFARVIWSYVHEGLTIQQSIDSHRNAIGGWRDVLGLPRL